MRTQKTNQPRAALPEIKKARRPRCTKPLLIAVCNENPAYTAHIGQLAPDAGINAEAVHFPSADALMRRYRKGRYAVIFCGIETARQIRRRDPGVIIALTPGYADYTPMELTELNILKVIQTAATEDDIQDTAALYGVQRCNLRQIVITQTRRGFVKIPADTIYRVEKRDRGCAVYSTRGIIKTGRASDFDAITAALGEFEFMQCEGGVLINPRYMRFMDESEIPPAANTANSSVGTPLPPYTFAGAAIWTADRVFQFEDSPQNHRITAYPGSVSDFVPPPYTAVGARFIAPAPLPRVSIYGIVPALIRYGIPAVAIPRAPPAAIFNLYRTLINITLHIDLSRVLVYNRANGNFIQQSNC